MTNFFVRYLSVFMVVAGFVLVAGCTDTSEEQSSQQTPTDLAEPTSRPIQPTSEATIELPTDTPESVIDEPTITIVYDNTAYDDKLAPDWGFAALVEYIDFTLLFDTGGSGAILLKNMMELEIDPSTIDAIVLSHEHGDHIGGLTLLLAQGIEPTIYVPSSFSQSTKSMVSKHAQLVEVTEPVEIYPGLYSTGEMGSEIQEQALTIETNEGTVVLTGCSHPGIVNILHRVGEMSEEDVYLVAGGFHLLNHDESQIETIVEEFQNLGVDQVVPTHCTGELAQSLFAEMYDDQYDIGGAGRVLSESP